MIPKKIHYCWFGGKELPSDALKYIEGWKKKCPDYEIILWNEDNFNINCNDFVKKAYEKKAWAFVTDYARLKIIYENGGIYLDTDVELIRNLDDLLVNDAYFGIQQGMFNVATGLGFGSIPKNPIIKRMMDVYENIEYREEEKEKFICPILNTEVLKEYGFKYDGDNIIELQEINIKIYPPEFFDPISVGGTKNLLTGKTYSIHHYNASWTSGWNKIKRKIFNFIGQDKINFIKKFKL